MKGWLAFLLVLRALGALFAQEQDQEWKFSASKTSNDSYLEAFFDPLFKALLAGDPVGATSIMDALKDNLGFAEAPKDDSPWVIWNLMPDPDSPCQEWKQCIAFDGENLFGRETVIPQNSRRDGEPV